MVENYKDITFLVIVIVILIRLLIFSIGFYSLNIKETNPTHRKTQEFQLRGYSESFFLTQNDNIFHKLTNDFKRETILHKAIEENVDLHTIISLIKKNNIDVHTKSINFGETALMVACRFSRIDLIWYFLGSNEFNLTDHNFMGENILMLTSESSEPGMTKIVKFILYKVNDTKFVNNVDNTGLTALFRSIHHNKGDETLRALINAGAFLNITDGMGYTPLIYAAWKNNADAIRTIFEFNTKVENNFMDAYNSTSALMQASVVDGANAILALLDTYPGYTNVQDANGMTALMYAVESGSTLSVQILIQYGKVDFNATVFSNGRTALMLACIGDKKDTIVQSILNHQGGKKSIDIKDYTGKKAIDYCM